MEVLFFHPHVIKSTGDALVDLVDYCMRKMAYLSSIKHARDDAVSLDLDEKVSMSKMVLVEERQDKRETHLLSRVILIR